MNPRHLLLRVAGLAVAVAAAQAVFGQTPTIGIDQFTGSGGEVSLRATASSPLQVQVQTGLGGVLGGERTARIARISEDSGIGAFSELFVDSEGLSMTNTASTKSEVILEYGKSAGVSFAFSMPAPTGQFRLVDWRSDTGTVQFDLTLWSGASAQTASLTLAANPTTAPQYDPVISFTQFAGIDFSTLDQISLKFSGQNVGIDASAKGFVVDSTADLIAIPEPPVYALLLALLTFGGRVARRWAGRTDFK